MWLVIFILVILAVLSWTWLMGGRKLRIYVLISNGIAAIVIGAMLIISTVDKNTVQSDNAKYEITQGAILSSVEYRGEEEGYYIIEESGLFYNENLAIPAEGVEVSGLCRPGAEVKLYREKGTHIVYSEERKVELKDGGSAYLVDGVVSIKFDAGLFALWVMVADAFLLSVNAVVCLIIAVVVKVHKKKPEEKLG